MAVESNFAHLTSGFDRFRHGSDAFIAWLAERQHGVVATWQLLAAGLTHREIEVRLRKRQLHSIYRGVAAVGHTTISQEGRWMAGALAGGPGAALSHRAAGAHLQLCRWRGAPEVTVPTWRRSTPRLRFHSSALPVDEVGIRGGIPITTVPRTLLDLASILDRRGLERALNEAEVRQLGDTLSIADLLARHPRRRGAATLQAILAENRLGLTVTRSELEEKFLAFIRARGLAEPDLNASIHVGDRHYEADCLWRRQRLIVELDGVRFHGTAHARLRDPARKRRLLLAGYRVITVTWRDLTDTAEANSLAVDLHAARGAT